MNNTYTSRALLTHERVAEFWRKRFLRQKHVNAGVQSLLRKYGDATSAVSVATEFLLTLMGNMITSEACLFVTSGDARVLRPLVARGKVPADSLPSLLVRDTIVARIAELGAPGLLNSLPRTETDDGRWRVVSEHYTVFAPLRFNNRLEGIVFLGAKVADTPYRDNDLELLDALCAVTASVLVYSGDRRMARVSADRSQQIVAQCQALAAGIADHLDRTLANLQTLAASDELRAHEQIARQLTRDAELIRHVLSPLRLIQRNPAALDAEPEDHCDIVAAMLEAILTFEQTPGVNRNSVAIRSESGVGTKFTRIDHQPLVDGIALTLAEAAGAIGGEGEIAVDVDDSEELPRKIGDTAGAPGAPDGSVPPARMLRIRIQAAAYGAAPDESASSMRILAGNVETLQTIHALQPPQKAIVDAGGAILWRREKARTTWLIYVPLVVS